MEGSGGIPPVRSRLCAAVLGRTDACPRSGKAISLDTLQPWAKLAQYRRDYVYSLNRMNLSDRQYGTFVQTRSTEGKSLLRESAETAKSGEGSLRTIRAVFFDAAMLDASRRLPRQRTRPQKLQQGPCNIVQTDKIVQVPGAESRKNVRLPETSPSIYC